MREWEDGLVGNSPGVVSGLAKRETLAQVLVRAFRPVQTRREAEVLRRAA
jgi:hypothetical protein